MPYQGETLIIPACIGWALWYYDLIHVDIEINGKRRK